MQFKARFKTWWPYLQKKTLLEDYLWNLWKSNRDCQPEISEKCFFCFNGEYTLIPKNILSIVVVRPQLFLPSYFLKLITDIQMKHSSLPFTQIQMDIHFQNFTECISRKKRITTSCMHFLNYRITLALLRNSVYHYESKGQETQEQLKSWV